jgi:hypothetical protein
VSLGLGAFRLKRGTCQCLEVLNERAMLERIPNRVEVVAFGAGAICFSLSRFFQSSAHSLYNSRATSQQTSFPTSKLNFYKHLSPFARLAQRITTKLSKTDTSFAPNTRDSDFSKDFSRKSGKRAGCERSSGYVYQVSTHPGFARQVPFARKLYNLPEM